MNSCHRRRPEPAPNSKQPSPREHDKTSALHPCRSLGPPLTGWIVHSIYSPFVRVGTRKVMSRFASHLRIFCHLLRPFGATPLVITLSLTAFQLGASPQ